MFNSKGFLINTDIVSNESAIHTAAIENLRNPINSFIGKPHVAVLRPLNEIRTTHACGRYVEHPESTQFAAVNNGLIKTATLILDKKNNTNSFIDQKRIPYLEKSCNFNKIPDPLYKNVSMKRVVFGEAKLDN